jgi:hypothetical protein
MEKTKNVAAYRFGSQVLEVIASMLLPGMVHLVNKDGKEVRDRRGFHRPGELQNGCTLSRKQNSNNIHLAL